VELTPIQMFARNVYHLLFESGGRLPLSAFESAYLRMFGTACQPAQFGQLSIISLLQAIPGTVLLRGRANKKTLVLNKDLACEYFYSCRHGTVRICSVVIDVSDPSSEYASNSGPEELNRILRQRHYTYMFPSNCSLPKNK
jgi:hypothetical protein